jgi:hypothetical protein
MTQRNPSETGPATALNIVKNDGVLWLLCLNCDRERKADLSAIVARGLGARPVQSLRFRCSACDRIERTCTCRRLRQIGSGRLRLGSWRSRRSDLYAGTTIVSYVHRRKRPPRKKPKPASALAVPAIVTHNRRRGPRPAKELAVDPEADARLVEFFRGMGLTYNPWPDTT